MEIKVIHDEKNQRFYAIVDDKESVMNYKVVDQNTLNYYRTFVDPSLRGKKIAEKIVTQALNYARDHHLHVIPGCSYVESFIKHHPEYSSLIVRR